MPARDDATPHVGPELESGQVKLTPISLKNNAFDFRRQCAPDPGVIAAGLPRAQPMTPGQAARLAPGSVVKMRGQARPGPDGVLRAPLSGRPCVWYRCYVQYGGLGLQPLPRYAPSDMLLVHQGGEYVFVHRNRNPADEISESPFVVTDGTASWTIDPHRADVDTDVLVRNDVETTRHRFLARLMVEWIVPVDAEVLLFGTIDAGPAIDESDSAYILVSTKTEQQILERDRSARASGPVNSNAFRFVRASTRLQQRMRVVILGLAALFVLIVIIGVVLAMV